MSNFVMKVRNKKASKIDEILPLISSAEIIGPFCKADGITRQWLNGQSNDLKSNLRVTNAIICELNEYRARNNHTWKHAQEWICRLLQISDDGRPAIGTIQTQFSLTVKRKAQLKYSKVKLCQFLEEEYKLPPKLKDTRDQASIKQVMSSLVDKVVEMVDGEPTQADPTQPEQANTNEDLENMTEKYVKALEELENLRILVDETKLKWQAEKIAKREMAKQFDSISMKYKRAVQVIDDLRDKIAKYTPRNVTKREKRLLQSKTNLAMQVEELTDHNTKLKSKVEDLMKQKWNKSKLARYYREEREKTKEEQACGKCGEMRQRYEEIIAELEEKLEEQNIEANERKVVQTYEKGHYSDKVVKLYMNLLTKYNVGARNASGIVKEVLSELGDMEAERLPKYTWITQVLIRARTLSQIQVLEELLKPNEGNTLHLDGTSKKGEHYGTFDISTKKGTYVLGLRDMAGGSASEYFETFDEIVTDVSQSVNNVEKELNKSKIIASLKNMMTDRCIVNKKFGELLEGTRQEHLPNTREDWQALTNEQKHRLCEVNDLYCGLHYLVGLAENAEQALKIWEGIIATQPLGAMAKGFRSSKGESGTQRLIRTSVKAFEEHGCEASGVMGPFDNFLAGKGISCKLKPFRGNRFNILFEDGGAVYYHHDHMTDFILKNCPNPNQLIKAVMADLAEDVYLSGARALGIMNYRLTTPLWSVLESTEHIFDMNSKYQRIVEKLNSWSSDPTELLHPPKEDDDFSKCLVSPIEDEVSQALYSEEISDQVALMTAEALQVMCAAMARVSERMLVDHLAGGRWDSPSANLRCQTESVPTTNIASEHDFGQLDRLKREKPNANTIAIEALVMYVTNHTSSWFASLPVEQQHRYLTMAREKAPSIMTAFYTQRQKLKDKLTTQRLERERLKREKEVKQQREKELLTKQLGECGGLWTQDEVQQKLQGIPANKQREAISTQLKFRHRVLQQTSPDNTFWYLSKGGKPKDVSELSNNLLTIIKHNKVDVTSNEDTTVQLSCRTANYRPQEERRNLLSKSVHKIQQQAKDDKLKLLAKKRQKDSQKQCGSPTKRRCTKFPSIPELVGKQVEHLYEDELTGAEDWYTGIVVRRVSHKRMKDPLKVLYEIHYEDGDQAEINLAQDYLNGELRLIDEPFSEASTSVQ